VAGVSLFEDELAVRAGWKRLDDHPFPGNLQLRHRYDVVRAILAKTGRLHLAEREEPVNVQWLDAARVLFTYPGPVFYVVNTDRNTVREAREGWSTTFDGDGALLDTSRILDGAGDGLHALFDALKRGPTPSPEQN